MRWVCLLLSTLLAGCNLLDDPAVTTCEAVLSEMLKSPASYRRISADIEGDKVLIKYEAANSSNAMLRSDFACTFEKTANGVRLAFDEYRQCEQTQRKKFRGVKDVDVDQIVRISCADQWAKADARSKFDSRYAEIASWRTRVGR